MNTLCIPSIFGKISKKIIENWVFDPFEYRFLNYSNTQG
jgi:hypothetical protein